jgi:hypothetical protein
MNAREESNPIPLLCVSDSFTTPANAPVSTPHHLDIRGFGRASGMLSWGNEA